MRYKEIYIIRYNNGERNFRNERTIFDSFQNEEFFGDKAKEVEVLYIERLKEVDPKAFEYYSEYTDITSIQVDLNNLDRYMSRLKEEIYNHSKTVSGDDDSFDYFPDLIYAFLQICEHLNRKDDYNEVVTYLNENDIIADDKYDLI